MMLSECCSAPPWGEEEYGICGDCKDHCSFYNDEEEEPGQDNRRAHGGGTRGMKTIKNLIGWVGFIALFFAIAFIAASVLNGYLGVREDKAWHDNSLVLMQKMKETKRNK